MIDAMLVMSSRQAVVGDVTDVVESTVLTMGKATQGHQEMAVICKVSKDYTGDGTLQAVLQHAVDDGSGSPDTFVTVASGPVVAAAALKKGKLLFNGVLPADLNKFIRMHYVIGGEALTALAAGTVDAWLDAAPETARVNNT
jgi:ABC-type nitrate/sulfonate/bicarbonate transport system substrate-binding protein